MKKKVIVVNFLMSFTVLFAMLFQTVHSYEHVIKQFSEKHCVHKYTEGQKEITHSHAVDNTCHICHFAFSTYIPNFSQEFSFYKVNVETSYHFFYSKNVSTFFKGSLFALRAPPIFL
ncbi:hypothetical protein BD847_3209 [Flavobacterium cutihirudinis]|uniref:DUF2946 domain-containing protein n=1 Tax=Flavobacterium cutihirudinis TaxID=1265740 RepID=A0A3D9FQ29_9FLAO|nr:hypothetical protein [Flavobacterium cutihirudinis]RED22579.1 hypothetical protein BD847_3209 [Flavobacterium cutihirudinis]